MVVLQGQHFGEGDLLKLSSLLGIKRIALIDTCAVRPECLDSLSQLTELESIVLVGEAFDVGHLVRLVALPQDVALCIADTATDIAILKQRMRDSEAIRVTDRNEVLSFLGALDALQQSQVQR